MNERRHARRQAFRWLFELEARPGMSFDVLRDEPAFDLDEHEESLDASALPFARELVQGTLQHRTDIDGRLAAHAPAYPVQQLATTDRAVLELAVYELLFCPRTPVKVVINEAVELAKTYGGESSGRFVNGVLGTIAEELDRQAHPNNPSAAQRNAST